MVFSHLSRVTANFRAQPNDPSRTPSKHSSRHRSGNRWHRKKNFQVGSGHHQSSRSSSSSGGGSKSKRSSGTFHSSEGISLGLSGISGGSEIYYLCEDLSQIGIDQSYSQPVAITENNSNSFVIQMNSGTEMNKIQHRSKPSSKTSSHSSLASSAGYSYFATERVAVAKDVSILQQDIEMLRYSQWNTNLPPVPAFAHAEDFTSANYISPGENRKVLSPEENQLERISPGENRKVLSPGENQLEKISPGENRKVLSPLLFSNKTAKTAFLPKEAPTCEGDSDGISQLIPETHFPEHNAADQFAPDNNNLPVDQHQTAPLNDIWGSTATTDGSANGRMSPFFNQSGPAVGTVGILKLESNSNNI